MSSSRVAFAIVDSGWFRDLIFKSNLPKSQFDLDRVWWYLTYCKTICRILSNIPNANIIPSPSETRVLILRDLWIWNISKIRLILIKEYLSFLMDIKCHMLLFTWTIKTNQKFNILINILVAIIIRISENKYVWVKKNNNVIDLNVSSLIFYTSFKIWLVQCVG